MNDTLLSLRTLPFARLALTSWLAVTAVACGSSPRTVAPEVDAGEIDEDVDGGTDPGTDAARADPDASTSPSFMSCSTNADCGSGTSFECLTVFPGGMCSRRCSDASSCGADATCFQGVCFPTCASGGDPACDGLGATCLATGDVAGSSICYPSCFATPPEGQPSCNTDLVCDPYSGACDVAVSPGAANGAPCMEDGECASSRCIPEVDAGSATGWIGGYCLSFGRQVSETVYNDSIGGNLPQSNCPDGSVVLPLGNADGAIIENEMTQCWARCSDAAPCREGYVCDHLTLSSGGAAFADGACFAINCAGAEYAEAPNRGCPTDFTCAITTSPEGMENGVCTRS